MLGEWVGRVGLCSGLIPLDAEEKVGRDQDRLEREGNTLFVGVAVFLRQRHKLREATELLGCRRAAERAAREALEDLGGAGCGMVTLQVPTDKDLAQACFTWSLGLCVRTTDL